MGRALTYWERERRRRDREFEREQRVAARRRETDARRWSRAREREQIRTERASERDHIRAEKARERELLREEKRREREARERERERKGHAAGLEARRAVERFDSRIELLEGFHRSDEDLFDFQDDFDRRTRPTSVRIKPFVSAPWTRVHRPETIELRHFEYPEFLAEQFGEPTHRPIKGVGVLGVGLVIALYATVLDLDPLGLIVAIASAGALTEAGSRVWQEQRFGSRTAAARKAHLGRQSSLRVAHETRRAAAKQFHDDAEVARSVAHRQVEAVRASHFCMLKETYTASEELRRLCWELHVSSEKILAARWVRHRIDVLERARDGERDVVLTLMRCAFPLPCNRDGLNVDSDGRWDRLAIRRPKLAVDGELVFVQVEVAEDGVVPTHVVSISANGHNANAKKMATAQRAETFDRYVASYALAHALHAYRWLPFLDEVVVEVVKPGVDPVSGKPRMEPLLSARYPRDVLEDTVLSTVDALDFLARVEHQRKPANSRGKKVLSSWLEERSLVLAFGREDSPRTIYEACTPSFDWAERSPYCERDTVFLDQHVWEDPFALHLVAPPGFEGPPTLGDDDQIAALAQRRDRWVSDLRAAIAAARAGDTIFIEAGTYVGDLVIDKPLTIVGDNRKTILRNDKHDTVCCTSVGVTLCSLVLDARGPDRGAIGCYVGKHDSATVMERCVLRGDTRYLAMVIEPGNVLELVDCVIDGEGAATQGVHARPETRVHVEGGTLRGCEQGVLAHDFDAEGLTIETCRRGVRADGDRLDPDLALVSLRGCRIERNKIGLSCKAGGRIELDACELSGNERDREHEEGGAIVDVTES